MRYLFLTLLIVCASASALDYPVDIDAWSGRTNYLNTDTGSLLNPTDRDWPATDPDTYTCPNCGINPGFSSNIVPVRRLDAPPTPSFDTRMFYPQYATVICGETDLAVDCDGQSNVIKTVITLVDQPLDQRVNAVTNQAAYQLRLSIPENELFLRLLIQVGLNAYRLDSQALPTTWQAFNDGNLQYIQTKVLPIWTCMRDYRTAVRAGDTPDVDSPDACWPAPAPQDLPE